MTALEKEWLKTECVMPMLWNAYNENEKAVANTYVICANCGFRFYGCSMGSIRMMDMGMTSCSQCPENGAEVT